MELKEVFEPIVNFLKNFQRKEKEGLSKDKAKERLQLVLMQDRASVSPDFFEMMKKEIIEVIKKYIEIDEETLEVQLTRGFEGENGTGPALYANIPIKNIKPVARKISLKDEKENVEEAATKEPDAKELADTIIEEIKVVAEEKMDNKKSGKKNKKSEKVEKEKSTEETKEEVEEHIDKIEEVTKEIKENAEEIAETVQETAEEVVEEVVETTETTKATFKEKLTGVKEGVANTFTKVKGSAKEGFEKIKSKVKAKN